MSIRISFNKSDLNGKEIGIDVLVDCDETDVLLKTVRDVLGMLPLKEMVEDEGEETNKNNEKGQ